MDPQSKYCCKYIQHTYTRPDWWKEHVHPLVYVDSPELHSHRAPELSSGTVDRTVANPMQQLVDANCLCPPISRALSAFCFHIRNLKQHVRHVILCLPHHILLNDSKLHLCGNTVTHSCWGLMWTHALDRSDRVGRPKPYIWPQKPNSASWCGGPQPVIDWLKMCFQANTYFVCTKTANGCLLWWPDTRYTRTESVHMLELWNGIKSMSEDQFYWRSTRRATEKENGVQGLCPHRYCKTSTKHSVMRQFTTLQ